MRTSRTLVSSNADLTSGLPNLTSMALRDLRGVETPVLVSAIRRTIDHAAGENATQIQQQRQ